LQAEIRGLECIGTVMATKKQREKHGRTVQRFGPVAGESRVICLLMIANMYTQLGVSHAPRGIAVYAFAHRFSPNLAYKLNQNPESNRGGRLGQDSLLG
jgi:hypothetical protein